MHNLFFERALYLCPSSGGSSYFADSALERNSGPHAGGQFDNCYTNWSLFAVLNVYANVLYPEGLYFFGSVFSFVFFFWSAFLNISDLASVSRNSEFQKRPDTVFIDYKIIFAFFSRTANEFYTACIDCTVHTIHIRHLLYCPRLNFRWDGLYYFSSLKCLVHLRNCLNIGPPVWAGNKFVVKSFSRLFILMKFRTSWKIAS